MNFFDKLTKKANETYQVAKEKTTNISEELKLKSKINNLENDNNDLYTEIGKAVYNELVDGKDVVKEEILPKIECISKNKSEIEKIQSQILALKKVKKCVKCGAELEQSADFCSKCGAEQPKVSEEKVEVKDAPTENAKEAETVEVNNVEDNKEE